jgi:hypothetical protein
MARKSFCKPQVELLGVVGHGNLVSVYLETVLGSVHDLQATGSKIVLDASDGTPR